MTALIAVAMLRQGSGHAKFDILADSITIAPGKSFLVAARFRIDPEWHIYWKNPGDSGVPTSVKLTFPKGFVAAEIQWPGPKRFVDGEIVNYGYADEAVLLIKVTPPKALKFGSKVAVIAEASWMSCKDMCVMGAGKAALALTVGAKAKPSKVDFSRFRERIPIVGPKPTATYRELGGPIDLLWKGDGTLGEATYFYSEAPDVIQTGSEQNPIQEGSQIGLRLKPVDGKVPPTKIEGVLEFANSSNKPRYFVVIAPCKRAD